MKNQMSLNQRIEEIQIYGNNFNGKRYTDPNLTERQQFLYTRAIHGLSVYSEKELCEMAPDKALRIIKVQKKTKGILNTWKQEIINDYCVDLFTTLFPPERGCNQFTRDIIDSRNDIDPSYDPEISFRKLGISKMHMVQKLMDEKILPPNFHLL